MTIFKIGDVVQLACGSPSMVVEAGPTPDGHLVLLWIVDGRDVARLQITPDALIPATAPTVAPTAPTAPTTARPAQIQAPTSPGAPA